MKTIPKASLAVFVIALAFSCKQAQTPQQESAVTEELTAESKATASDPAPNIISSNAAVADKDPKRKFVRTADIRFKVKNVAKSTYAIENTVTKFGGIVTNTNLQSHIDEKHTTKVSQDSTLETTRYTVENNITIRIPNTKLDTVIKTIRGEVDFLDYRIIKADDVALKMLSNQLAQSRTTDHTKRLADDIDSKGRKLVDINDAENNILDKQEQKDNAAIANLSLRDQVNFSTITLALYQNESVKQELVAIAKNPESYGNFGLEILDGLKTGWFILERIIAFVVQFWSLFLLAFLGIFIYRKLRKQKPLVS